jgi:hypothetical protein
MRCSAIVRMKSSAPTIIASPSMDQRSKASAGLCVLVLALVVLSGKTSYFHPRHVDTS